MSLVRILSVTAALAATAAPVAAQSLYLAVGTTGLAAGYAHSYSERLAARLEAAFLPSIDRSFTEDGIDYSGDARSLRGAALLDWHPLGGGLRLSAGLSAQDARATFAGAPVSGTTITIGGATVSMGPADRYEARIELPAAMPYLGIGWGGGQSRGWGLHADLGVLIGEAKVSGTLSPGLSAKIAATGRDPQAELDRELQTVRDAVAKMPVFPVLSIGASYRW
jgi:hypothetical protein